jgi:hypothetical protein
MNVQRGDAIRMHPRGSANIWILVRRPLLMMQTQSSVIAMRKLRQPAKVLRNTS